MAATGYLSTGAFLDTGIGIARIHGEIIYTATRTNNTISFTSVYAQIKYIRESGSWTSFTYGSGWTWNLYVDSGSHRAGNAASGTRSVNAVDTGSAVGFSIGVSSGTTSVSARVGAYYAGDGQTFADHTLGFPAAGSPSGQTISASLIKVTSVTLNAAISTWGSYCTAGTGQRVEYKKSSSGSWTTLDYSTSTAHSRSLTGLTPGTTYDIRTYTSNGAGLTGYSSTGTFKTKSATNLLASLIS